MVYYIYVCTRTWSESNETLAILRSGGWENGCLYFDSNGTAAWLDVVLTFDTFLGLGNAWESTACQEEKKS